MVCKCIRGHHLGKVSSKLCLVKKHEHHLSFIVILSTIVCVRNKLQFRSVQQNQKSSLDTGLRLDGLILFEFSCSSWSYDMEGHA